MNTHHRSETKGIAESGFLGCARRFGRHVKGQNQSAGEQIAKELRSAASSHDETRQHKVEFSSRSELNSSTACTEVVRGRSAEQENAAAKRFHE